jgi:4-amino-4-deoxy-L-arabinose transferase-like glycosyltransferase
MTSAERIHARFADAFRRPDLRWRILLAIAVAAFLFRVALIFHFDTWHISSESDHFSFGWEPGRLARSLAEGKGFASPFVETSGPTAWLAPGYPWLLSLLFRLFGTYSANAALAAFVLNSVFSSLTCIVVYHLGKAFYDESTGLAAAALFAISPSSIWHAIASVWDVTVSALLLAILLYSMRRIECAPRVKPAVETGFIAGILALFSPSCLGVYAAGLLWIFIQQRHRRITIPVWGMLAGVPLALCLPWLVRNERVFHRFTLKSNFGTELRIGNNPLALSSPAGEVMDLHPATREFGLYRDMGELGYVDYCERQALEFIRGNPRVFARLISRRVIVFWAGVSQNNWTSNLKTMLNLSAAKRAATISWSALALLGLAIRFESREHLLPAITLLVYPLPYYLTHANNRYRTPIEPVLVVLIGHLFVAIWRQFRSGRIFPTPLVRTEPRTPVSGLS